MRTRVITPITSREFGIDAIQDIVKVARPDNQVDHVFIDHGPASIENEFEDALAMADTCAKVLEAEQEGIQAVMINCMGDPGVYAARHLVSIPVVGPFQAAAHIASTMGRTFSVVTVLEATLDGFRDRARLYGLESRLASVRSVDIPVLELEADRERMIRRLVEESVKTVKQDGADSVIFGCTGMAGVAEAVQAGVARAGYEVPVIDPAPVALKLAELMVDMRLLHSRRAFPFPSRKPIRGFEFLTRAMGDLAPSAE